jgi:hypothetical protein
VVTGYILLPIASQSVGYIKKLNNGFIEDNMTDFVIINLDIMQRLVKSEFIGQ